jgi:D-alanine-D-alanine ligase
MEVSSTNAELLREFWRTRREATTVALVSGGRSVEDRRFLADAPADRVSRYSIEESLDRLRIRHHLVDPISPDFVSRIASAHVVFVNVHGEFGEDGRLQGLLDWLEVPYTHSGVRASAIAQHKPTSKRLATALGILTPEAIVVHRSSPCPDRLPFDFPVVCKPASGGSSIALSMAVSTRALVGGIAAGCAADVGGEALVERFVEGRHVTVAIVELLDAVVVLPPLDVCSSEGLYGEKTKLGTDEDVEIDYACPARIAPGVEQRLQEHSLLLFREIECKGVARVDWIVDPDGQVFFLEVNVVPGLSASSNVACAAEVAGLGYDDLVATLVALPLHDVPTPEKPAAVWSPARR